MDEITKRRLSDLTVDQLLDEADAAFDDLVVAGEAWKKAGCPVEGPAWQQRQRERERYRIRVGHPL